MALRRRSQTYGETNRAEEVALGRLAHPLEAQGNLAEAEGAWREELAVERTLSGDEHPFVANSLLALARVLKNSGRLGEAEQAIREAVEIPRKSGKNAVNPQLASSLALLILYLLDQQKFAKAEATAREALTIRAKKSPDDWLTFNSRSQLGGSLLGQKKYTEAEPLLIAGYEGMKQRESTIPAAGKARIEETLQRLVQLYEAATPNPPSLIQR